MGKEAKITLEFSNFIQSKVGEWSSVKIALVFSNSIQLLSIINFGNVHA